MKADRLVLALERAAIGVECCANRAEAAELLDTRRARLSAVLAAARAVIRVECIDGCERTTMSLVDGLALRDALAAADAAIATEKP